MTSNPKSSPWYSTPKAKRRGDFTAKWAAEDCAARYTYPYATAARFEDVRTQAAKGVK